jgi:hypothetical protein
MQTCPVCQEQFPSSSIQRHVNQCLDSHAEPPPTPPPPPPRRRLSPVSIRAAAAAPSGRGSRPAAAAPAPDIAARAAAGAVAADEVNALLNFLRIDRPTPDATVTAPPVQGASSSASAPVDLLDTIKGLLYLRILRIEAMDSSTRLPAPLAVDVRFDRDTHVTHASRGDDNHFDDGENNLDASPQRFYGELVVYASACSMLRMYRGNDSPDRALLWRSHAHA